MNGYGKWIAALAATISVLVAAGTTAIACFKADTAYAKAEKASSELITVQVEVRMGFKRMDERFNDLKAQIKTMRSQP